MPDDLKRTPLADTHRKLGGKMVPFAGWEMPVQYQGVRAEHQAVRGAAGMFDVSHMGEIETCGPQATTWYRPGRASAEKSRRYVSAHGPNAPDARTERGPKATRPASSRTTKRVTGAAPSVHATATLGPRGR